MLSAFASFLRVNSRQEKYNFVYCAIYDPCYKLSTTQNLKGEGFFCCGVGWAGELGAPLRDSQI